MSWIDGTTEFKCEKRHSAKITSSTYRFRKKGFNRYGEEAKALCSMSSINILAMTADVEQRTLATSMVKPLLWKRYVDNVISAVSGNEKKNQHGP